MIDITPAISIHEHEVEEHFIRAPGPGGQKVNKTESSVQLRYDARHSAALSNALFLRLKSLAGRHSTHLSVDSLTLGISIQYCYAWSQLNWVRSVGRMRNKRQGVPGCGQIELNPQIKCKMMMRRICAVFFLWVALLISAAPSNANMSDVDFDLLSARMANALKKGEFEKALPMIQEIKNSGREYTPSLIYFEGFTLQKLGRLDEADKALRRYLELAGKGGAYYQKTLERIVEIEDAMGAKAAQSAAHEAQQKKAAEDAIEQAKIKAQQEAEAAVRKAEEQKAAMRTPGHKFKDCDTCPEMVVIPPGHFTMGSTSDDDDADSNEFPAHPVTIGNAFAIGVYEITHAEFSAFLNETQYNPGAPCHMIEEGFFSSDWAPLPQWPVPSYPQLPRHPAVCTDWADAKVYAKWLSQKTGATYRLPTEAEWEYAARAGTQTRFSYGDDTYWGKICHYGNTSGWSDDCLDGYAGTVAPVGKFRANPFGLYDMHGNILEWVEDCYADTYENAPSDGSAYLVSAADCIGIGRGGAYFWHPESSRSASRWARGRGFRIEQLGFRIVREIPQ